MASDPLRPLLELVGVEVAAEAAKDAVFAVHRLPANLRNGAATAAEAAVRAARASAAIEGVSPEIPADAEVRDPILAGALRLAEAQESLLPVWRRAPLQALARMHVLAAGEMPEGHEVGRPRLAEGVAPRLELLAQLITGATSVPGVVLSGVVHGELLTLQAFSNSNGVVARAAARLTMISSGLDPKALTVPEVACFRRINQYRAAATDFAQGTPETIRNWLLFWCEAVSLGAREAQGIANSAS